MIKTQKTIFLSLLMMMATFSVYAQQKSVSVVKQVIQHNIYIKLKDDSPEKIKAQFELGKEYLSKHPGQISLSYGAVAKNITRHQQKPNLHNIEDFDVVFSFIFEDEKAHDLYQVSERHKKFIAQSNQNWDNIRILDSKITQE